MDPVVAANHRWLAGYRHPRCGDPQTAARLREVFAGDRPLMAGAEAAGDPIATLPVLFHLMWWRETGGRPDAGTQRPQHRSQGWSRPWVSGRGCCGSATA